MKKDHEKEGPTRLKDTRTAASGRPASLKSRLDDSDTGLRIAAAQALLAKLAEPRSPVAPEVEKLVRARLHHEREPAVGAILQRILNRIEADRTLGRDPSRGFDAVTASLLQRLGGEGARQGQGNGLADRYELMGPLAEGGMARIFRARRRSDGMTVVIKILLEESLERSSTAAARFEREARIMESIACEQIARVFEHGVFEGRPYLVMEYFPEGSLADRLWKEPLTHEQARRILADAARALVFLHGRKLIHRDIKPANILLTGNSSAKLSDFGLARDPRDPRITHAGELFGSPAYMAPEQARDPSDVTTATDIYAFGITVYETLSGGLLPEIDYRPLASIDAGIPDELDRLVRRALSRDPQGRPSAQELLEILS